MTETLEGFPLLSGVCQPHPLGCGEDMLLLPCRWKRRDPSPATDDVGFWASNPMATQVGWMLLRDFVYVCMHRWVSV